MNAKLWSAVLALCVLAATGCGDVFGTGDSTIVLNPRSARPFEIIALNLSQPVGGVSTLAGRFGGLEVQLHTVGDSEVLFMLPQSEVGKHLLEFEAGNRQYRVDIDVVPDSPIANPDQYVANFVAGMITDVNQTVAPDLLSAVEEFKALSPADKQVAARVIESNRKSLEKLEQEIAAFNGVPSTSGGASLNLIGSSAAASCDALCYVFQFAKIVAAGVVAAKVGVVAGAAGAILAVAAGVEVGLSILRGKNSVLLSAVENIAGKVLNFVYWPHIATIKLRLEQFELVLIPSAPNQHMAPLSASAAAESTPLLDADNSYAIGIVDIPFRTLRAEDVSHPNPVIRQLIPNYEQLRSIAASRFGIQLPGFSKRVETKALDRPDRLSFSVQNNAVRISKHTVDEEGHAITFDFIDPNNSGPTNFELGVRYTNGEFTHRENVSLKLKRPTSVVTYTLRGRTYTFEGSAGVQGNRLYISLPPGSCYNGGTISFPATPGTYSLDYSSSVGLQLHGPAGSTCWKAFPYWLSYGASATVTVTAVGSRVKGTFSGVVVDEAAYEGTPRRIVTEAVSGRFDVPFTS